MNRNKYWKYNSGVIFKVLISALMVVACAVNGWAQGSGSMPGASNPQWLEYNGVIPPIDEGEYEIQFREIGSNCSSEAVSFGISLPVPMAIETTNQQNVAIYSQSTGSITIANITGGASGNKQINFNDDPTRQYTFTGEPIVVSGLVAGDYFIEASDAKGCTSERLNFTITQPDKVTFSIQIGQHESLSGANDGFVIIDSVFSGSMNELKSDAINTSSIRYPKFILNDLNYSFSENYVIDSLGSGQYTLALVDEFGSKTETIQFEIESLTEDISSENFSMMNAEMLLSASTISVQLNNITTDCDPVGKVVITNTGETSSNFQYALYNKNSNTESEVIIGGEKYPIIKIGNQSWLGRNLHWDDGQGGVRSYNDNPSLGLEYGYLYNWNAAMRVSSQIDGWHLPSQLELNELGEIISNQNGPFNIVNGDDWNEVGGILKEIGLIHWNSPNPSSDNYGFSTRGTGGIGSSYPGLKQSAIIWSSTSSGTSSWSRFFYYTDRLFRGHLERQSSYVGVRLLKNSDYSSFEWKPLNTPIDTVLIEEQGQYFIVVKDESGNISEEFNFDIKLGELPEIHLSDLINVTEYGTSTGSITISNIMGGAVGNKQININNDPTRQYTFTGEPIVVNGLSAGDYFIEAIDAKGCTSERLTFTITQPACSLELLVTNPSPVCEDKAIDLTQYVQLTGQTIQGAEVTYWMDEAMTIGITAPQNIREAGTYYVNALTPNGCEDSGEIEVRFNALPELTITNPTPVCSGESIDLTVAEVTNHADLTGLQLGYYTDPAATSELTNPTAVTESGTYYVKAVNANTCVVVKPIEVQFNPLPELTITNPTPVCTGESIDLTAAAVTGNTDLAGLQLSYWRDAAATIALNNPADVTESGTYYLKAVNANSCVAVYPVEVKFNALPELTIINVLSANGAKTVDLTQPRVTQNADLTGLTLSYWHDALAVAEPIQQPKAITVTGTYYIKAKTANGCSTVDGIAINMEATNGIYAIIDEIVNVSCSGANNGKATLKSLDDENGGILEYQLDNGPWVLYQEDSEVLFENLAPGTHYLSARDALGCYLEPQEFIVGIDYAVSFAVPTHKDATCDLEGNDGMLTIANVTGGSGANYKYSLDNGSTWNTYTNEIQINDLAPAVYAVMVKDGSGCQSPVKEITIGRSASLIVDYAITPITCFSREDGKVTIHTIEGSGNTGYRYNLHEATKDDLASTDWQTISSGGTIDGLGKGKDTIYFSDATGCAKATIDIEITEPELFELTSVSAKANCRNPRNIQLLSLDTIKGGTAPYSWSLNNTDWSNLSPSAVIDTFSVPQKIELWLKDQNGCVAEKVSTQVKETEILRFYHQATFARCGNSFGADQIYQINGGSGTGLQYNIDNAGWNEFTLPHRLDSLTLGVHNLAIKDDAMCVSEIQSFETKLINEADLDMEVIIPPICSGELAKVVIHSINGDVPVGLEYSVDQQTWHSVVFPQEITGFGSGTHQVYIKDGSCRFTSNQFTVPRFYHPIEMRKVIDQPECADQKGKLMVDSLQSEGLLDFYFSFDGAGWAKAPDNVIEVANIETGEHVLLIKDVIDENGKLLDCISNKIKVDIDTLQPIEFILETNSDDCSTDTTLITFTNIKGGKEAAYFYSFTPEQEESWLPFTENMVLPMLNVGSYSITVKNGACQVQKTIDIEEKKKITYNQQVVPARCFDELGKITLADLKGGCGYGYQISIDETIYRQLDSTGVFSAELVRGEHTLAVRDNNGCRSAINTMTIEAPELPVLVKLGENFAVHPGCLGKMVIDSVLGGTGSTYQYSLNAEDLSPIWTNAQSGTVLDSLTPGIRTIAVRDSLGCKSASENFEIVEGDSLSAIYAYFKPSCFGNEKTISFHQIGKLSDGYQYKRSNDQADFVSLSVPFNLLDAYQSPSLLFANSADTVEVAITTIPLLSKLMYNQTINEELIGFVLFNGGAKAGYRYKLDDSDNFVTNGLEELITSSNTPAGIHRFAIIDTLMAPEATIVGEFRLTGGTRPVFDYQLKDAEFEGDKGLLTFTELKGGSGFGYKYKLNNNPDVPFGVNEVIELNPGTHTLSISDSKECTSSTKYVTVSHPEQLSVQLDQASDVLCFNDATAALEARIAGVGDLDGQVAISWFKKEGALWAIIPNSHTATLAQLGAGTYKVVVEKENVGLVADSITIAHPNALQVTSILNKNSSCYGEANGAIEVKATGGTAPLSYRMLDNGPISTTNKFNGLLAGSYVLEISDGNGCRMDTSIVVTQPATPFTQTIEIVKHAVGGGSTGSIKTLLSGGSGYYFHVLKNANGQRFMASSITKMADASVYQYTQLPAGEYSLEAYDYDYSEQGTEGCTVAELVRIEKATPVVTANLHQLNPTCFNENNGSISFDVSGGLPYNRIPYHIEWEYTDLLGVKTRLDLSSTVGNNLAAGAYSISITDSIEEQTSLVVTLVEPDELKFGSFTTCNVICFGGNNGTANWEITGGVAPYVLKLNDKPIPNAPIDTLKAGTYTLTVEDRNGCSISKTFNIEQPVQNLELKVEATHLLNKAITDGKIDVTIVGGWKPYRLQLFKMEAGNFVLKQTIDITDNKKLYTGLAAGVYQVAVTDNILLGNVVKSNCFYSTEVELYDNPKVIIQQTNPVVCFDQKTASLKAEIYAIANVDLSYRWTKIGGAKSTTTLNIINGLNYGNYYVEVLKGTKVIAKSNTITIANPEALIVKSMQIQYVGCFGGSDGQVIPQVIGGVPPYSYLWSNNSTEAQLSAVPAGSYGYTITDANGCIAKLEKPTTVTNPAVIKQPSQLLDIELSRFKLPTDATKKDGSITASIKYGWIKDFQRTLVWKNEQDEVVGTGSLTLPNVGSGSYTLYVEESYNTNSIKSNVCSAVETFDLYSAKDYPLNLSISGKFGCPGDKNLTIAATLAGKNVSRKTFTYAWYTIQGTDTTLFASVPTISKIGAGSYKISIKEVLPNTRKGRNTVPIQVDSVFTIADPLPLATNALFTAPACMGEANGKIELMPSGGASPYLVAWDNGSTNLLREELAVGIYPVSITDANFCTRSFSLELKQDKAPLTLERDAPKIPSGYLAKDGSFKVVVTGGATPYSYAWTDKQNNSVGNTPELVGVGYGTYNLTVTDAAGCTITETFSFGQPPLYIDLKAKEKLKCPADRYGELTLFVDGGKPFEAVNAYDIKWYNKDNNRWYLMGINTLIQKNLTIGEYRVEVKDQQTTLEAFVSIESMSNLSVTMIKTDADCKGNLGKITALTSGGVGNNTYLWSPTGKNTSSINQLPRGNYSVKVTDDLGCVVSASSQIKQSGELAFTKTITQPTCTDPNNGAIAVTVSGGSGVYPYRWTGSLAETESIDGLAAGHYELSITDNDCFYRGSFELLEPNAPEAFVSVPDELALCTGQVQPIAAQMVAGNTYQWSSEGVNLSDSANINISEEGSYNLTITDPDGCKWLKTVEVNPVDLKIDAEFLMASFIYPGETLVLVNTSDEEADEVQWICPDGAVVTNKTDKSCELTFATPGEYEVTLFVLRGGCYEEFIKKIVVADGDRPEMNLPYVTLPYLLDLSITPNPSQGNFDVVVKLSKEITFDLKMYNAVTGQVVPDVRYKANHLTKKGEKEYEYKESYSLNIIQGSYVIAVFGPNNESRAKQVIISAIK